MGRDSLNFPRASTANNMHPGNTTIANRSVAVVMPAAGNGRRFGRVSNKLFALLDGKPLWLHCAERLRSHAAVGPIIMAIAAVDKDYFAGEHAAQLRELDIRCVDGGAQRSDSVRAALDSLGENNLQWVAVHDAARPLIRQRDLDAVFAAASVSGAAILATPVAGTVKRDLGERTETVDRRHLFIALTPQVFEAGLLQNAYAKHNGRPATDDAELVERLGYAVTLVQGASDNLKITYPEDLIVAEAILRSQVDEGI